MGVPTGVVVKKSKEITPTVPAKFVGQRLVAPDQIVGLAHEPDGVRQLLYGQNDGAQLGYAPSLALLSQPFLQKTDYLNTWKFGEEGRCRVRITLPSGRPTEEGPMGSIARGAGRIDGDTRS